MAKKYKVYTAQFKFKVALEALKSEKTVGELCNEFELVASQIHAWKKKLEENGAALFSNKSKQQSNEQDIEQLHATIGKLKVECDFLAKALGR